jgi:hypothetical protein
MEFYIYGNVNFNVEFDVEAENEEQALEIAKDRLMDYYHLNVVNAVHSTKSVQVNINANEYE